MASIQSKIIRAAPGWLSGRSVQLSILAKPHIGCTDYFFTILKKKKNRAIKMQKDDRIKRQRPQNIYCNYEHKVKT